MKLNKDASLYIKKINKSINKQTDLSKSPIPRDSQTNTNSKIKGGRNDQSDKVMGNEDAVSHKSKNKSYSEIDTVNCVKQKRNDDGDKSRSGGEGVDYHDTIQRLRKAIYG